MQDTPYVATPYCPTCDPGRDPLAEVLDVRWCTEHEPGRVGEMDAFVRAEAYLGTNEAGGDDNRWWCSVIHGGRR